MARTVTYPVDLPRSARPAPPVAGERAAREAKADFAAGAIGRTLLIVVVLIIVLAIVLAVVF